MIEKRRTYEITQGNGDILHKTVLESVECVPKTDKCKHVQIEIFRILNLNPDLTCCGLMDFETLSMKHDGTKWVLTLTALEKGQET